MARAGIRSGFSLDPTGLLRGFIAAQKEYNRRALKAIKLGALFFEAEIKKELSKPGTGRARKVKGIKGGRGGSNRASAPGEPPAVDFGRLRSSITHEIEKEFLSFVAKVGTNVEYAKILEFGGHAGRGGVTFIAARPYMLPTLIRIRPQLISIFQKALSG